MQSTKETLNPTTVKLTIVADSTELEPIKASVIKKLGKDVRLQGFRPGKAPAAMVERSIDQAQLQNEFLEQAVNQLYVQAVESERLRPVAQPQISVTKFVPFTTLELTAEVEAVGEVKLPDYKKLSVTRATVKVTTKQVDDIMQDLRQRLAERKDSDKAAVSGDEATIDFKGVDAKTKEAISGADGSDYPLLIGSGSFIPGFEDEIIGLKVGEAKDFTITFPTDYGAAALQNKKVTFSITVKKLQKLVLPKVDDEFVAKVGPFKSVPELEADIRRELENQANTEVERKYESELVEAIAKKTKVALPKSLVDEEIDRSEQQDRQNVLYKGQTWQEHLDDEGVSEEEHREKNRAGAEIRVKAGLVLGEIADAEKVQITSEELDARIQELRQQYVNDERMQTELAKPEGRRDILSRMLTEKTIQTLKSLQN